MRAWSAPVQTRRDGDAVLAQLLLCQRSRPPASGTHINISPRSWKAVLRITRQSQTADTVTLKLEGRLMGPWAGELDRVVADSFDVTDRLVLDLSGLMFADREGIELLRALSAGGASLSGGSSFVTALLTGDLP